MIEKVEYDPIALLDLGCALSHAGPDVKVKMPGGDMARVRRSDGDLLLMPRRSGQHKKLKALLGDESD